MHRHLFAISFCLSLLIASLPAALGAEDTVSSEPVSNESATETTTAAVTVAVLPFVGVDKLDDLAPQVSDLVNIHLSGRSDLSVVERGELDKALSELELGKSGMVSEDAAARIGHLTGAAILVTGRVFAVQNEIYIAGKMIGVETGRMFGEVVSFSFRKSFADASQTLATKIGDKIAEKGSELVAAAPEQSSDLVETLMLLAHEKKLPVISVMIVERHVRQQVLDPAAETEMSLLFQKLGFSLVDAATTTTQPDIEVTGEAFSEFGLRKGNLVSCRARVEVKAIERETGRVVAVDRETAVAVDIAEQVAGKAAIQKAADQIAQRIALRILEGIE